jgi:hypothetical protein
MTEAPTIETERLRLRGHRVADFADVAAMWAAPEVVRHIMGRPLTRRRGVGAAAAPCRALGAAEKCGCREVDRTTCKGRRGDRVRAGNGETRRYGASPASR